jgi:hypothetical protein
MMKMCIIKIISAKTCVTSMTGTKLVWFIDRVVHITYTQKKRQKKLISNLKFAL